MMVYNVSRRGFLKSSIYCLFGLFTLATKKKNPVKKISLNNSKKTDAYKHVHLKPISIKEGLFSGEKSVVLENYDGNRTSGFFEDWGITEGKLEVKVYQEKKGLVLIKLPGRTMEAPGDKGYLTVKKTQLEYVA